MNSALRTAIPMGLTISALSYGIWHYHSDAGRLRQELKANQLEHAQQLQSKDEEHREALMAQAAKHQQAVASLQAEHERKLTELRNRQSQQMNLAIKEFENIFAGNQRSLEHLDQLEAVLAKGGEVAREELERLAAIASGIGFLKNQYRKPMQDFTALQQYFEEAGQRKSSVQKPSTQFGFFKRMFSREFREAEKEALREEGAKRAFDEASGKFEQVYQSAQQSMRKIDLDVDGLQKTIQTVIDQRQKADTSKLSDSLRQIREALKTHQKVLDFSPQPETPKVQP
jgi:hypothetical protein